MSTKKQSLLIQMFHVHKTYGNKKALVDLNLDVYKNDFLFITGPSGAGKTTLLKLLYLAEPVTDGQVLVDGMNLARISKKKVPYVRRMFGIIFQDYKLIPTKTIFENVALVLEVLGSDKRTIHKKVKHVLRTVGMEDRRQAFPPSLSGGEQQRVAVARAIVGNPKIILADEPTGSLDAESADIIFNLLMQFHARGGTVIVATHDALLLQKAGPQIIRLKAGTRLQE
jgi:cell division transport system ATP-binding protein